MRRLGSLGLVVVTAAGGCTIAGPRGEGAPDRDAPVGVPAPRGAEPEVRVGLVVDTSALEVSGTAGLELIDAAGRVRARVPAGESRTARRAGEGVAVEGAGETVRTPDALTARPLSGGDVVVNGKRYRGAVLLRPAERGVTAVNLIDLETYLLGVVPLEIGRGRPPEEVEAVKAQAIAARTYAVRHMGRRDQLGFDFYATVMDQVYGGVDADDEVSARAVRETRGEVLVHDGQPIEAYYHSTCGGRTAALEEVWPGEPRPYLQSVSDARPGGGYYCESSNRFRWTEIWTQEGLLATLERGLSAHVGRDLDISTVRSMAITGRTTSGRAEALRLATDAGDFRVRADSIRWVLRPEPGRILNSALIELHPDAVGGEVVGLTVDGGGWGHGIGMCQIGAVGRARAGHSYRDILLTYYPGSQIARLYR